MRQALDALQVINEMARISLVLPPSAERGQYERLLGPPLRDDLVDQDEALKRYLAESGLF